MRLRKRSPSRRGLEQELARASPSTHWKGSGRSCSPLWFSFGVVDAARPQIDFKLVLPDVVDPGQEVRRGCERERGRIVRFGTKLLRPLEIEFIGRWPARLRLRIPGAEGRFCWS